MPKISWYVLAVSLLLAAGCDVNIESQGVVTPTLLIITSTLPATATARPSETSVPSTAAPTVAPVEGTTITQLNVRAEPSTASEVLGTINAFSTVQIVGKDPGGNWYQILFEAGPDRKGWVTAAYVQTAAEPQVPVIGGAGDGPQAVATQQINVRSGPGTDFNSLGTINAQDVVTLTGKNASGTWLQIEFAAGPDGKGWVNAAFVQATGVEELPIIAETGQVVGTGTPAAVPPPPTATIGASASDDDSASAPAVSVVFSPLGSRALFYTSDVSSPEGDAEDWIQFTPYTAQVWMQLQCEGNGTLSVDVSSGDEPLTGADSLSCASGKLLVAVSRGQPTLVHLHAALSDGGLESVHYTLSISTVR
ncbi:MAG TPA: SH3 domain-containing protein [Anaerolineales bacterium]|jgi:uncharacterized protein YraI